MPSPTVTISTSASGSDRIRVHDPRSRVSSAESASVYSPAPSSGSHSLTSFSSEDDYVNVRREDDGIVPSDSASRSRQPARRRNTEAPLPPSRRHSSRRPLREEEPRRRQSTSRRPSAHHPRSESRPTHSDDSVSVASGEEYAYYGHHGPAPHAPHPPRSTYSQHPSYRHVPGPDHGGYRPSMTAPGSYQDPYATSALVQLQGPPGHYGYQSPNPFEQSARGGENPFSPMSQQGSAAGSSYFAGEPMAPPMPHHRPHGPPRPQSFAATSQYPGAELMSQYGGPPNVPAMYPGYGMPFPPPWGSHYGQASPPLERRESKKTSSDEIESLRALIKQQEEARITSENERLATAKADAADAARKTAETVAEKKKQEEIAAASKKAKEEAEKTAAEAAGKAKEEHEKKLAEAKKAQEELEKKHKELEAEAAKLKPTPDSLQAPIRFKDAIGRKFSFPWHICKTWKGMEGLIRQAFSHLDDISDMVQQGQYDLTGPDGEIILPQVWDAMIKPDTEVVMHIWPMPEPDPRMRGDRLAGDAAMFNDLDFGSLGLSGPPKKKKSNKDGKKKDKDIFPPMNIPPAPPAHHGGMPMAGLSDPMMNDFYLPQDPKKPRTKPKSKSSSSKDVSGFAAWVVGGSRASKKK